MAKSNPTTILLLGGQRREEIEAAAAVRPGDLIERIAAGTGQKHSSAGGYAEKMFALEDALQGKEISENYADGDIISAAICAPGDKVYAWLSGGETAVIGSKLTSNGDGALKVATGTNYVVAVAEEAVDASDSNDVDERIKIRIL